MKYLRLFEDNKEKFWAIPLNVNLKHLMLCLFSIGLYDDELTDLIITIWKSREVEQLNYIFVVYEGRWKYSRSKEYFEWAGLEFGGVVTPTDKDKEDYEIYKQTKKYNL